MARTRVQWGSRAAKAHPEWVYKPGEEPPVRRWPPVPVYRPQVLTFAGFKEAVSHDADAHGPNGEPLFVWKGRLVGADEVLGAFGLVDTGGGDASAEEGAGGE